MPIGALARAHENAIAFVACVCSLDGKTVLHVDIEGSIDEAAALGRRAAEALRGMGAAELVAAIR